MIRIILILLVLVLTPHLAQAQTPGCQDAGASKTLDENEVSASVFNNGLLHRSGTGSPRYLVPRESPVNATFQTSLIVSGLVDGEKRVSGSLFGPAEFWPGPYQYLPQDPDACAPYDRMYSVRYEDLRASARLPDILEWPHHLGAPVVDGDGNPGNYDFEAGDRPEILGDESVWWLMNDGAGVHRKYETEPLGLEIRGTAFAWDLIAPLGNTTFYRYWIRNAGEDVISNAHVAIFMDVDLNNAWDDRVGSDSTLGLAYYYNDDPRPDAEEDEIFRPEAIGYTFIRGPHKQMSSGGATCVADSRTRLTTTSHVMVQKASNGPFGEPHDVEKVWHTSRGRSGDGAPIRKGWYMWEGSENEAVTTWVFPGDPITNSFWSEYNLDRAGTEMVTVDKRSIMGMGPFCLNPGDEEEVVLAVVWSQGADQRDSVRQLKKDVRLIRSNPNVWISSREIVPIPPDPEPEYVLGMNGFYPNPASVTASLKYSLPQAMQVRLEVFDVLGRQVHDSGDEVRGAGEYTVSFDVSGWPAGVYTARLLLDHIVTTRTFMVVR